MIKSNQYSMMHAFELASRVTFAVTGLELVKNDQIADPATAKDFGLDVYNVRHVGSTSRVVDCQVQERHVGGVNEKIECLRSGKVENRETPREERRIAKGERTRRVSCPAYQSVLKRPESRRYSSISIGSGRNVAAFCAEKGDFKKWNCKLDLQFPAKEKGTPRKSGSLSVKNDDEAPFLPVSKTPRQITDPTLLHQLESISLKNLQDKSLSQTLPKNQFYDSHEKSNYLNLLQRPDALYLIQNSAVKKPAISLPPIEKPHERLQLFTGNTTNNSDSSRLHSSFDLNAHSNMNDLLLKEGYHKGGKYNTRERKIKKSLKVSDMNQNKNLLFDENCLSIVDHGEKVTEKLLKEVDDFRLDGVLKHMQRDKAKQSECKRGLVNEPSKEGGAYKLTAEKMQKAGRERCIDEITKKEIKSIMKGSGARSTPKERNTKRKVSFNKKVIRILVITKPIGNK